MSHIRFAPVSDEVVLTDLACFDASAYGEKDVPLDVLSRWWRAFPAGARIAQTPDGRIVGAMSGWPLRAATYDALVAGRITEEHVSPADFVLEGERTRWYISGIAVSEQLRATPRLILAFLADGLAALGEESRCAAPDVCAVATTVEGQRMLRRFGFVRHGETPHGVAYEKCAFRDERIGALADRLLAHA